MPTIFYAKQTARINASGHTVYSDILMASHGSAASDTQLRTLSAFSDAHTNPNHIGGFTAVAGGVAFYGPQSNGPTGGPLNGGSTSDFYVSDGTVAGTTEVSSTGYIDGIFTLSGTVYALGGTLFRYDPGATALTRVTSLSDNGHDDYSNIVVVNGTAAFTEDNYTYPNPLDTEPLHNQYHWVTDGTAAGTRMGSISGAGGVAFEGTTYYLATNGLYKLDAGGNAVLVKAFTGGSIIEQFSEGAPGNIAVVGNYLYLEGYDADAGSELWRSDGTAAGTVRVADIAAGGADSFPGHLTAFNGELLFQAMLPGTGPELFDAAFAADGSVSDIEHVDIVPGMTGSFPSDFITLNGILYFDVTGSGTTPGGIYKVDPATGLSLAIRDLHLGSAAVVHDGRIYFEAPKSDGTDSLYSTNGTQAGTIEIATEVDRTAGFFVTGATIRTPTDFNGDGHSDILWRNDDGNLTEWQVTGDTGQLTPNTYGNAGVGTDWHVAETFDFNGDGLSDILWRNAGTGQFTVWEGAAGGGFAQNAYSDTSVGRDWQIAGVGDLDGDGKDDIVWHNDTTGTVTTWLSTGTGFSQNVAVYQDIPLAYRIVGTGDFDGDGKADLLWRNQATGQFVEWASTGRAFAPNTYTDSTVGTDWHVASIADFDGDGKSDILWRNAASGEFTIWTSTGTGFTPNTYVDTSVGSDWQIAQTGDFNGDGKADILWRNSTTGTFTIWQSNGHGFDENVAVQTSVGTDWHVQGHDYLYG